MDIACPACSTRYIVPDSAIGMNGRVLRCAKCRHSWFQDGPQTADDLAEALAQPDAGAPAAPEAAAPLATLAAAAAPLSPIADSPPGTYVPGTYPDQTPVPDFAETPSIFAHEPPFRPRRSRATWWILAAMLFVLVAGAAIAAMANFGVPDWLPLPHNAFAEAQPDLELNFPQAQQQWQPLPNGNTYFNVSGSIANASTQRRAVPTLEIVLRDMHNVIVYSLETASPKPVLAPGESETLNQAIIDAPKSARSATIGWKRR